MILTIAGAAVSVAMLTIGIAYAVACELQWVGRDEPQSILRMSYLALIFGGLTSLIASVGR